MKCQICDTEAPAWSWTDTHGIAQCWTCGTPYRIIHYDDNQKRIEKEPEIVVKAEHLEHVGEYWNTFGKRIPSGCSFEGGQELATHAECLAFYDWWDEHVERKVSA